MQALHLAKKIPAIMRSTRWKYLMDGVDLEIQNARSLFSEKKQNFDIDSMNYENIIALAKLLNIPMSVAVFRSNIEDDTISTDDADLIAFLKRELDAIPFKVQYKSTVALYRSIYKAIERDGQIFIYKRNDQDQINRYSINPLLTIDNYVHDVIIPYIAHQDYSGSLGSYVKLDSDIKIDAGWRLDDNTSYQTTNHYAVEMFLDRLVTKITAEESSIYLLSSGFFKYMESNANFSRRAREVAHVGAQLGIEADTSGRIDSPGNIRSYTVPSIHANAVIIPSAFSALSSIANIYKISFGIGSHSLPSQTNPSIPLPTALANKIASTVILAEEKLSSSPWWMLAANYQGCCVCDLTMHNASGYQLPGTGSGACDGTNYTFSGVIPYAPLIPGQVTISFIYNAGTFLVTDDGQGNLAGGYAVGSINYATGAYTLSMNFTYVVNTTLISSVGSGVSSINTVLLIDSGKSIIAGSFKMTYRIGNRYYVVRDNSSGGLYLSDGLNPYISSGSITYATGALVISFSSTLDVGSSVLVQYSYNRTRVPDAGSAILLVESYVKSTIEITEAGLFTSDGTMVAYATFPPVEFESPNHHLNMHFYLHNGAFA